MSSIANVTGNPGEGSSRSWTSLLQSFVGGFRQGFGSSSKSWTWASLLPLIFLLFMLTGLCQEHKHRNIIGVTLCEHRHIILPNDIIRVVIADESHISRFERRGIGSHCDTGPFRIRQ